MLSGSTPAGGELFIPAIKTGTGPSGSGHTLPGETGPLPDRAHGMTIIRSSTPAGGELFIPAIKTGTGPSGSGHTLPGETGPLPDRAHGMTREAENPGL
uniref:Uncharacterized protein n=1 Tax=Brassica oleracea var. oleracea TaxID=109376 RepID=A0A0D3D1F9_BRAOL